MAQLVARAVRDCEVVGSNPITQTIQKCFCAMPRHSTAKERRNIPNIRGRHNSTLTRRSSCHKPPKEATAKGKQYPTLVFIHFLLVLFCGMLATLLTPSQTIEEVPLSNVIARANDENGDIAKITLEGSTLKITKKGEDRYSQTSRKDSSGTLYEQEPYRPLCWQKNGDELTECQSKYPVIEYKEVSSFWDYALDIAIIVIPVIIIILFFSSMMRQAQSMNNQSMGFGKAKKPNSMVPTRKSPL